MSQTQICHSNLNTPWLADNQYLGNRRDKKTYEAIYASWNILRDGTGSKLNLTLHFQKVKEKNNCGTLSCAKISTQCHRNVLTW